MGASCKAARVCPRTRALMFLPDGRAARPLPRQTRLHLSSLRRGPHSCSISVRPRRRGAISAAIAVHRRFVFAARRGTGQVSVSRGSGCRLFPPEPDEEARSRGPPPFSRCVSLVRCARGILLGRATDAVLLAARGSPPGRGADGRPLSRGWLRFVLLGAEGRGGCIRAIMTAACAVAL